MSFQAMIALEWFYAFGYRTFTTIWAASIDILQ